MLCRGLSAPAAKDCQGRDPTRVKCSHTKNTWEKQAFPRRTSLLITKAIYPTPRYINTLPNCFPEANKERDVLPQDRTQLLQDPESQAGAAGRKTKERLLLWHYLFYELVISSSTFNSLSPSPEAIRLFTRSLCFAFL